MLRPWMWDNQLQEECVTQYIAIITTFAVPIDITWWNNRNLDGYKTEHVKIWHQNDCDTGTAVIQRFSGHLVTPVHL